MKIKLQEVEPTYEVELTRTEIELVLDGLHNIVGRYQGINDPKSTTLHKKAQDMISQFEIIHLKEKVME